MAVVRNLVKSLVKRPLLNNVYSTYIMYVASYVARTPTLILEGNLVEDEIFVFKISISHCASKH